MSYSPESDFEPVQTTMKIGDSSTLNALRKKAYRLKELRSRIAEEELRLSSLKDAEKELSHREIPELMADLCINTVKFEDVDLEITKKIQANVSKERINKAVKWLEENGHDAIVKTTIGKSYGKGEREHAKDFIELLKEHNISHDVINTIHPQTLKAFVTEMVAKDNKFPRDLFGVYEQTIVKLK